MKIITPFLIAAILLVAFVGFAAAQTADPGDGMVDFTVMNLSDTYTTTVTAQYVNQSGGVDATINQDVEPLSSKGFNAADSGLPDPWVGSAIASASQEIASIAQIRYENGDSTDTKVAASYDGILQGANKIYFPSLAARTGKQRSEISVQSAQAASVSTIDAYYTFYNRDGTKALGPISRTIPGGAQVTIDLDADLTLPNTAPAADGWLGAAVVTSTESIAGVAVTHWKQYSAAYAAVTNGATTIYLPSATRRTPSSVWKQFTSLEVQNLDTTTEAEVRVNWYDRYNNKLFVFTDTIPANSTHGYNTRWLGSDVPDNTALQTALGDDWNGSVIISSTNSVDIVSIVKLQWTADHPAGEGASSYYSFSEGYPELYLPAVYRVYPSSTWEKFTGLIVQNVGTTPCIDFMVEWYNPSGTQLISFTDSLSPTISHGYNTRYAANNPPGVNMADLGTSLNNGSVYFNAPGCSLNAMHNTVWPAWTDSTTYNGYGK